MKNTDNFETQFRRQAFKKTHKGSLPLSFVIAIYFVGLQVSCTKNDEILVTTKSATNITENSATIGGSVSGFGYTIEECGVCYNTIGDPTINDHHTEDHFGTGSFSSTLSGLLQGTKYYVRAYANTSSGIRYGNEVSFSTSIDYTITISASPIIGGTVSGGGTYKEGQSCNLTATANNRYSFSNWTENGIIVSTNANYTFTVNGDRTIIANFTYNGTAPTGAINGLFSVNATKQVWFSKGNLQYQASTDTWRFATHQYDYIGEDNENASSSYNGWIDLFGWGTSGYNHGAVCYQPWSSSQTDSDYYAYGGFSYNLYDQTGTADWGYNAISNGGNTTNFWRTLTGGNDGEWFYLIWSRNTASGIRFAKARVANVNGVILLPDNWDACYHALNNTNSPEASYGSNTITASIWEIMEQHGAVFLPAAGHFFSPSIGVVYTGSWGSYWSSSYDDSQWSASHDLTQAYDFSFFDSSLAPSGTYGGTKRHDRESIRLVHNAW